MHMQQHGRGFGHRGHDRFAMRHGGAGRGGDGARGPFGFSFDGGADGRGGRSRRMFEGGELRLVLLNLIADEPRHGYELIRAIEEMTGGVYAPSPGVVYPGLTMLGELGLIEEQASEGARKRFACTEEGRTHLIENAEQLAAILARLTLLAGGGAHGDHMPVRRAMGNLRHAVQNRVARGDLSRDALHDIAALIDTVAQQVERLA